MQRWESTAFYLFVGRFITAVTGLYGRLPQKRVYAQLKPDTGNPD
jgi:hypothetical protein